MAGNSKTSRIVVAKRGEKSYRMACGAGWSRVSGDRGAVGSGRYDLRKRGQGGESGGRVIIFEGETARGGKKSGIKRDVLSE